VERANALLFFLNKRLCFMGISRTKAFNHPRHVKQYSQAMEIYWGSELAGQRFMSGG
jgi:hypothetical protein